jgi:hypothetical protein
MTSYELWAMLIFILTFAYAFLREVLGRSHVEKSPKDLPDYRVEKRGSLSNALTLGGVAGVALAIGSLVPFSRDLQMLGAGMWLVGCLLILRTVRSVPTAKRSCIRCANTLEVFRDSSLPHSLFAGQRGYLFVCHSCKTYHSVVTATWGGDA